MDRKRGQPRTPTVVRLRPATLWAIDEIGRRGGLADPRTGKVDRSKVIRQLLAIAIRAVLLNPKLFTDADNPLGV